MRKIAIIPARGGSKRITNKNIRNFFGKPIIAYSIEAALKSKFFNEVMVSTDDQKIVSIARKYGATVPFMRSRENSDDYAPLKDVMVEVLEQYKIRGIEFEIGCCILSTAPLLQQKYLKKGLDLLVNKSFDSVRPVVRFSYPIQRARYLTDDYSLTFINQEFFRTRSQDLKPSYHDAGQFYWFYTKSGMSNQNCGGFEIKEIESQDIDSEEDFQLLCLKYELLNKLKVEK